MSELDGMVMLQFELQLYNGQLAITVIPTEIRWKIICMKIDQLYIIYNHKSELFAIGMCDMR